jgi:hypothetical protein
MVILVSQGAEIASVVGVRQEVVTDAEGRLKTISTFDERGKPDRAE